jgi:hypothetical protein
MELAGSRIVTDDVEGLAAFYARLVGISVALNEYYVEVPARAMSVGFSNCRFTEYGENQPARPEGRQSRDEIILDFLVDDVGGSTSASRRWAWRGSYRRPPSPGGTAR